MNIKGPGRSHRTPIKHFVLNLVLGQIVGALSRRNPNVPARLPLLVIDMCAGDGISLPGLTSSPELIHKHINFPALRGQANAILYEKAEEDFTRLKQGWSGHGNIILVHGDSSNFRFNALGEDQAIFIHIDPNSLASWPVIPDFARTLTRSTTFLATLGCNVGGLKRKEFDDYRREWYDRISELTRVPYWHDIQLYVLNRDKAQWAYLLRVPTAWADKTAESILRYGNAHWPNGMNFASYKETPDEFNNLLDELFLTKKERENGVR